MTDPSSAVTAVVETEVPDRSDLGISRKPLSPYLISALSRGWDMVVILLAGLGVYLVFGYKMSVVTRDLYVIAWFAGAAVGGVMLHWARIYDEATLFHRKPPLARILSAWAVAFSVLLALAFLFKVTGIYSRIWVVSWFVTAGIALAINHMLLTRLLKALADQGRFAARTVIVGAGEHGQRLAAHLREFGDFNVRLLGFVDDRSGRVPREIHGYPLLGDSSHLLDLVRQDRVDQVFISLPWSAEVRLQRLIHELATSPVRIRLAPDLVGFQFIDRAYEQVARLPMLNLYDRPFSGWSHVVKTFEDRVLAGLGLVLLAPLFAAIALAIKLDTSGPVFFRQTRLGFNHQPIRVWKFRTMYADRTDAECEVQTTRKDPRVTRVGAFLRRASLDELPQLINVALGEMSIVGPRPHARDTKAAGRRFEEVVERYAARHRVKPGITGWAQVNGWRGETDTIEKIQRRVEHDLYYIDNWSLWLDLTVIARTVAIVLKGENAY